ncbi:Proline iminopeptidase [Penicillium diatomitis]|uniref:Proline iminopeptidase n=1 Tax=Penicillium diatomitis TaxID=2819901 RepID=A0A9X0C2U7_9EURO|nr:Proline iminopeptidase [Penicillium diatomitis]KAJ5495851.1 Proline iminopeptidase [Penicillium diatomitis]
MAARLVEKHCHNVPGKLRVTELFFDVPVDYQKPNDGRLRLFARSVTRWNNPIDSSTKEDTKLPWLVYLQGGPGFGCGPPQNYGFVEPALSKGYQILFLDQRGTGLSSTVTAGTLARQGDAIKQAEYLKKFRADSIVRDCEAIREILTQEYPADQRVWSIIGQSFGGFCAASYLSFSRTFQKVIERNEAYYAKFPEDVARVRLIMQHLEANRTPLPSGWLTPARFQQLGIMMGFHGGLDSLHDLVLRAWHDLEIFGEFTDPTLALIDGHGGMDKNIIYAVLHEAIYCQNESSSWTADRLRNEIPRFQINAGDSVSPIYFTGEMIFKDMFDSYTELSRIKDAAEILARTKEWNTLYNVDQLRNNKVPVYSATYIDDMYVHFDLASETAAKIGGLKHFITNTMYHDALRSKSGEVMRQLFSLRDDCID